MNNVNPLYIKSVKIHTEKEIFNGCSILIEKGKITGMFPSGRSPINLPKNIQIIDGKNLNAIPGFIDGHIHGAAGADMMDATVEALNTISAILPKEGTTSFLATTITQSPESIGKTLENIAKYKNKASHAELLGVHLEGPFIEHTMAGAQPINYIIKPTIEQFKVWQDLSGNKIKTITLAPEHDECGTFIQYLFESGVNVSAGHTATTFIGMIQAVAHGVRQVTHLCNAMTGIHHRDIGVVGAAFQLTELRAELIADGVHVSKEMLQLAYNNIGSKRLILITDAMRAKGLPPGYYELGGQTVIVTNDRAVLENGRLAGSILKMHEAAQKMLSLHGVSIYNIMEMASVNPAKQIGVYERKGSIESGKDADILLVDNRLNIKYTVCRGVVSYREE